MKRPHAPTENTAHGIRGDRRDQHCLRDVGKSEMNAGVANQSVCRRFWPDL